jgi:hypothetical protein
MEWMEWYQTHRKYVWYIWYNSTDSTAAITTSPSSTVKVPPTSSVIVSRSCLVWFYFYEGQAGWTYCNSGLNRLQLGPRAVPGQVIWSGSDPRIMVTGTTESKVTSPVLTAQNGRNPQCNTEIDAATGRLSPLWGVVQWMAVNLSMRPALSCY